MPSTILRPYYLSFRNRFKAHGGSKHVGKRDLLLLLVALIVMLCIFTGFVLILNSLTFDPLLEIIIPSKIISLLFYAFFVLLLISNTVACIGNIYNAKNMNLFLSTPVSSPRLFFAKLIETIFETSLMFVVFLTPVGLAYVYSLDTKPGFLIGSTLIAIPFLLIPSGLAVVIATIFVKISALVWKRGLFLFVCLIGVGFWALSSLLAMLERVQVERGGTNAIVQLIGLFDNPNPKWLPSRWAADLITYFLTGEVEGAQLKIALLCGTALGAAALGYLAFDFFLLSVRGAADASHRVKENRVSGVRETDSVRALLERIYYILPFDQQARAIILKDLTSLVRDRAQSLQLLMYLGIAVVYIVIIKFMSAAINLAPVALQAWWAFLASINMLFAGFIITAVMTRLVYPSISLEGRAFWILVTGPIELRDLIRAKVRCWLPLTMVVAVSLMLAGVLAINPSLPLILCSLYIGVCLSISCTSLAVGVGSLFASFEWESPNQISSGFGTLVLLLSSLTLVVVNCFPASMMTFIATIPALRAKLGIGVWPGLLALCVFSIFLINYAVSKYISKKGAEALRKLSI